MEGLGGCWETGCISLCESEVILLASTRRALNLPEAYMNLSSMGADIQCFRATTTVRWPPAKRDGQPEPTYCILPRFGQRSLSATVRSGSRLLRGRA
jgi:hypothetical protein